MTPETAEKYGLKNISDLSKVADQLTLYGTPECRQRMDCLLGLEEVYGLKFKKFVPVDPAQRHEVLQLRPRRRLDRVHDRPADHAQQGGPARGRQGHVPALQPVLVMKQETADQAGPDLAKTIDLIQKPLTDDAMQELDARVDLDKKEPGRGRQGVPAGDRSGPVG